VRAHLLLTLTDCASSALEEVDELYRSSTPPWKSASWRPASHRASLDAIGRDRRISEATVVGSSAEKPKRDGEGEPQVQAERVEPGPGSVEAGMNPVQQGRKTRGRKWPRHLQLVVSANCGRGRCFAQVWLDRSLTDFLALNIVH
jgi:hypothetical protein